jgi:glycerol-3-phosphate dehydrogenase
MWDLARSRRSSELDAAEYSLFDVVIVGGGINGACLYHHLCRRGFRVLLADKGDFASGTSQASAMMIWGGLLYLKNLDFANVARLSFSRDRMIDGLQQWVRPQIFRFIPRRENHNSALIASVLYFYWMMSGFRRKSPHVKFNFPELAFLDRQKFREALEYEEACVLPSDARFVLHWILPFRNEHQIPLNHCSVDGGKYAGGEWHLALSDSVLKRELIVRSKMVINTAGVWTDSVNEQFGVSTSYKHVFSKGVFLGLNRREQHQFPLILDTAEHNDCMSFIPWGPISLWGPTETPVKNLAEGFHVTENDIEHLLFELNENLAEPASPSDIVSFRCGVRPLAVHRSFNKDCYPLELSRKCHIESDTNLPWISVFGGKITDCVSLAESVARLAEQRCERSLSAFEDEPDSIESDLESFPGITEQIISPDFSAKHEMCWTLEDYLRRRTNLSQWVARGGLGRHDENVTVLKNICRKFCPDDSDAEFMLSAYRRKICKEFDELLSLREELHVV